MLATALAVAATGGLVSPAASAQPSVGNVNENGNGNGNDKGITPEPPPGPTDADRETRPTGGDRGASPESPGNDPEPSFKDHKGGPGHMEIVAGLEENEGLRTAGMKVFEVPGGGAHVAQVFTAPVHYLDQTGEWREIDTTLVPAEDGFRNAANWFDVYLPQVLHSGDGIQADLGAGTLTLSLSEAHTSHARVEGSRVTYPRVAKDVDLEYLMTSEGFKENLLIASDKAPSSFSYDVQTDGLELVQSANGSIEVREGAHVVAVIPRPYAKDAPAPDGAPGDLTLDIDTSLTPAGPGRYTLDVALDDEWLGAPERRFPIVLDPSLVASDCREPGTSCSGAGKGVPLLKDAYETTGGYMIPYDNGLFAGRDGGDAHTYMTFDVAQEIRKVGSLVYEARFDIYNYYASAQNEYTANIPFELKRITADWDPYGGPPPVDESKIWATYDPCADLYCGVDDSNPWWRWDVRGLMQYWIDEGVPSNHGWRISAAPGQTVDGRTVRDMRGFWSKERGESTQPYLFVAINAMPSTRPFATGDKGYPYLDLADDAPANDAHFSSTAPVLKIKELIDPNLDPIKVRYQVSKSATSFTGNDLVYNSGWVAKTLEHKVPLYALPSGKYFWRVQASDTCGAAYRDSDPQDATAGLCDDLGRGRPTSEVRSFTTSTDVARRGSDSRWAMWSEALGNGMDLRVDQASGNLLLQYPVDSLVTSGPNLNLGLSHNSDAAADGEAAPEKGLPPGWELSAGPGARPAQIPVRVAPLGTGSDAAEVVFESGRRDIYVSTDGKIFKTVGPMASTLRKNEDGGWALTSYTGGVYTFDVNGDLSRARPVSANAEMTRSFEYFFDASRRLEWVKDASGRQVRFEYLGPSGRLSKIVTWTSSAWTFGYDANLRMTSMTDPLGNVVELSYDTSGRLASVMDGEESAKTSGTATAVTYEAREKGPVVKTVTLAGAAHPWQFSYDFAGSSTAQIAASASVVDPRGAATTNVADDYKVITDFGVNGLPVMSRGPHVPPNPEWPVERWRWDDNGNLLCYRDAAANAVANIPCTRQDALSGLEALQTEYKYQKDAPFLVTEMTGPASNATVSNDRLVTRYNYDAGLTGLQAQYFTNANLNGIPMKSSARQIVNESWGYGGPNGLRKDGVQVSDNFSARYFGEFEAQHSSGEKTYVFRMRFDDRARLAVGDKIVVDCWTSPCAATGSVTLKAYETYPIVVEYADTGGDAFVELQQETIHPGYFETVPESVLRPNLDVLTSKVVSGEGSTLERVTYTYLGTEHLHLPRTETVTGADTTAARVTKFDYDMHGRVTVEEDQDPNGRRITHQYQHGCPVSSSDVVAGSEPFTTTRKCNAQGDIVEESAKVVGIIPNGTSGTTHQTRVTTTAYDVLGHPTLTRRPDGGESSFTYDRAGRLKTETIKVSSNQSRTTEYFYRPQGWVFKIVSPSPVDGGTAPQVLYEHDAVGNRVKMTDERGKVWNYESNSLNLRTSKEDPLGNKWRWVYDPAGREVSAHRPSVVGNSTHSAVVTKTYDLRGNLLSRRLASLAPTTYTYDRRDLLTRKKDPDGIATEWTYDAEGHKVTEKAPVGTLGTIITRKMTYSSRGLLESEENFKGKVTRYTYDRQGNLKTVTLPYPTLMKTTYNYNAAGDLEQVLLPRTATGTAVTSTYLYEYDYDSMGRVLEERNGEGEFVKHVYNLAGEEKAGSNSRDLSFEYEYDNLGRRTLRRAGDLGGNAISVEHFDYDLAGNMVYASNQNQTLTATYDAAGRPDTISTGGVVTDYDYLGTAVSSREDAAGETTYTYSNATGRLETVTTPFSSNPITFTYKPSGRVEKRTDPNGLVHTMGYDHAGRLTKQVSGRPNEPAVATFTQRFDADSHVIERMNEVRDGSDNGGWIYTYDDAGRLIKATDPQGGWSEYAYDLAGNRTKVVDRDSTAGVVTLVTDETVYDSAGRPATMSAKTEVDSDSPVVTQTTYEHDDAGNLTKIDDGIARWTYAYDPWNRMVASVKSLSATEVPISTSYAYDALDRTVSKGLTLTTPAGAVTEETERSFYAGLSDELVGTSATTETPAATISAATDYASAGGAAVAVRREVETLVSGSTEDPTIELSTSYIGAGPHGDVTFMTNPAGEVVGTKSYDPWGEMRTEEGEDVDFGYQGDPTDEETGLVDMGARYYLPSLGRFTSLDTYKGDLSDPLSENPYVYGEADPVSMHDPTGHAAARSGGCTNCDGTSAVLDSAKSGCYRECVTNPPPVFAGGVQAGAPPPPYEAVLALNTPPAPLLGAFTELTGIHDADICLTGDGRSTLSRLWSCVMVAPIGRIVKGGKLADEVADGVTALAKYDPTFAARQLLGGPPVTRTGLTITAHAARQMVDPGPGRIAATVEDIDTIIENVTRVIYQAPTAATYSPTLRLVAERLPGSPWVVVDAPTASRVITVLLTKPI